MIIWLKSMDRIISDILDSMPDIYLEFDERTRRTTIFKYDERR